MIRRRKRFMRVYHRLSQQGWCDGEGGMESRRVYLEWVEAGCPPLEAFIRWRANIGPLDTTWEEYMATRTTG